MVIIMEPRISGKQADDFIKCSGFEYSHRIEATGFSGGIWILWRGYFDVEVLFNHKQFVHFKISKNNNLETWITAVYASPNPILRRQLWDHLDFLARTVHGPWLVGGDFNSILCADEKKGGSTHISGVCGLFKSWFNKNGMFDLNFHGPRFTWSRGFLMKRLDRAMSNTEWLHKYPDNAVLHLPKIASDHRPILVRFNNDASCVRGQKPFRFLAAWLTDNSFGEFVSNAWINSLPYLNAADIFVKKALEWNRDHFGNIFQKKRRILVRLGGIQKVLETKSRRSLARLELKLKKELEEILTQEEILWLQKSRKEWLIQGDRNTAYFHQKTLARRRRNRITTIQNANGEWIVDNEIIKQHATAFFSTLYTSETLDFRPYPVRGCFPILDAALTHGLMAPIEDNEIRQTIFSMKPLKAPGVDGLHAIFYQSQWHIVGHSFSTMRVLWNGEASEEFVPSRGIRQGDPLSPYIFVLCVERLSHGINRAVTAGDWRPIRLARRGTPLTHLFFADDLLLLAEADIEQAGVINMVLNNFCKSSEAKVNKAKSQVFFSKNISAWDMKRIGAELGFSVTKDLGTYLGMPLLHTRVSQHTYQNIIDKVERRLSGWHASLLSLAGRITLTQTVLQAIPVYAMQTTSLPTGINMKIDKACRKFIWSGNSNQQRMSMVSWDTLCKPKAYGGLGLKDLNVMNKALLMKLSWGIISAKDSLWVQVLCTKYGVNNSNPPLSLPTRYGSHMWKAIGRIWSDTMLSRSWSIGDGKRIRFWWDCWVYKDKPLANQVTSPIPDHLTNLMVADCVAANGQWNWALFDLFLPHTAIMKIASIHPPSDLLGPDQFYWSHSNKGNFSASSAYNVIRSPDISLQDTSWNMVWKWQGPQGVKVFIWLALHGRLKTKAEIARRHMAINTECDRCGAPVEDILHVLRDCMGTKAMDSLSMVNDVKARTEEVILIQGSSLSLTNKKVNKWIGWSPPNWPWCKLNSDGACKVNGVAAAGGLIRDHSGHWVAGFGMNIGNCSVTTAELWGLYQGLTLAWNKGIRWLCVEVDSRCVTQLVKNNMVNPNEFSTLIRAIQELIRCNWRVEITHVYREANFAADYLATLACSLPLGLHVLNSPPKGVLQFMSQDNYGVVYPRLVIS
ncbi:putative ribonuclease H protein [Citrus sinensis]|nr:putative ribonuclease H protein [Citrus sinensis]